MTTQDDEEMIKALNFQIKERETDIKYYRNCLAFISDACTSIENARNIAAKGLAYKIVIGDWDA